MRLRLLYNGTLPIPSLLSNGVLLVLGDFAASDLGVSTQLFAFAEPDLGLAVSLILMS